VLWMWARRLLTPNLYPCGMLSSWRWSSSLLSGAPKI
jgi:hypothetical protein